jgi:hypothetical protein
MLLKLCAPHFVRLQKLTLSRNFGQFPMTWTLVDIKTVNGYQALVDREVDTLEYLLRECFREGPIEALTVNLDISYDQLMRVA